MFTEQSLKSYSENKKLNMELEKTSSMLSEDAGISNTAFKFENTSCIEIESYSNSHPNDIFGDGISIFTTQINLHDFAGSAFEDSSPQEVIPENWSCFGEFEFSGSDEIINQKKSDKILKDITRSAVQASTQNHLKTTGYNSSAFKYRSDFKEVNLNIRDSLNIDLNDLVSDLFLTEELDTSPKNCYVHVTKNDKKRMRKSPFQIRILKREYSKKSSWDKEDMDEI
jgi:hypothetical protein